MEYPGLIVSDQCVIITAQTDLPSPPPLTVSDPGTSSDRTGEPSPPSSGQSEDIWGGPEALLSHLLLITCQTVLDDNLDSPSQTFYGLAKSEQCSL